MSSNMCVLPFKCAKKDIKEKEVKQEKGFVIVQLFCMLHCKKDL